MRLFDQCISFFWTLVRVYYVAKGWKHLFRPQCSFSGYWIFFRTHYEGIWYAEEQSMSLRVLKSYLASVLLVESFLMEDRGRNLQ
jgi:hypothetical protein